MMIYLAETFDHLFFIFYMLQMPSTMKNPSNLLLIALIVDMISACHCMGRLQIRLKALLTTGKNLKKYTNLILQIGALNVSVFAPNLFYCLQFGNLKIPKLMRVLSLMKLLN